MTEDTRHAAPAKAGRFDPVSIALHWLTALLIAGQFATAWVMSQGGSDKTMLLTAHRSAGVLTWTLVVVRLIWRHGFARLPPFPDSMPRLQQQAAKLSEYGLYLLLLIQPLTGAGNTLLRGRPFALWAWQVPALLAPDKPMAHLLEAVHAVGAWTLLLLVSLHAAAGLFHGLVLRDGVLQRMLPRAAAGKPLKVKLRPF